LAPIYEHSFNITDIKVSEDSTDYIVSIFFNHNYLSQAPYSDDNWDIMIVWAWGSYAGHDNLEKGYYSASAYLTQGCHLHPITVDQTHDFCSLMDSTTTAARLVAYKASGCPDAYEKCCFADASPNSDEPSAGGYVLLDDISSDKFIGSNSGGILLEIRFEKEEIDWKDFKSKILDGIYIIMDGNTRGDDAIDFLWSPDDNHVNHDWYFSIFVDSLGRSSGCVPYGEDGKASSLLRLVDSMDDDAFGYRMGICNDWTLMGSYHEEFYKGIDLGARVRSVDAIPFSSKCDSHIIKTSTNNGILDSGGYSECTENDCHSSVSKAGVVWASEEKILGRDIGMSCDKDNDYSQCYSYDCDFTDNTCIKCNGKIQSEGKTGVNKCEENCGADSKCDEVISGTFGCSSNCCFGDLNNDEKIDIMDITIVAMAFGSNSQSLNWNPKADVDGKGIVDIVDISNVASVFGKNC
jgi:hypothetical protein